MKYFPQLLEISFVETELISQNKPPKIGKLVPRKTYAYCVKQYKYKVLYAVTFEYDKGATHESGMVLIYQTCCQVNCTINWIIFIILMSRKEIKVLDTVII